MLLAPRQSAAALLTIFLLTLLLSAVVVVPAAAAGEQLAGLAPATAPGGMDELGQRRLDFERFARGKVAEMNRNHQLAPARMRIERNGDGSYRALYHQIDENSLASEVSPSSSRTYPYVAVLSYRENVYAATCARPTECRRGPFTQVAVIPNRHIFTYGRGLWQ